MDKKKNISDSTTYTAKKADWQRHFRYYLERYITENRTFVPTALPEFLINLGTLDILEVLEKRYGGQLFAALNPQNTIQSPVHQEPNGQWLKKVNMVGINVRTIGSFWNSIKYALSLPKSQSSIHILPIWEPGVVASLYGISSWHINTEFFSPELQKSVPHLDTVEKQLKVVTNILHLMGKTVGMDVIPHTDRYSEIVLANPSYFEWLQRRDFEIVSHSAYLHQRVEREIMRWLREKGSAMPYQDFPTDFFHFFYKTAENFRTQVLFGEKWDVNGRIRRRNDLITHLYHCGLEPLPATMGPPYRGLRVSPDEAAKTVDADGRVWRDYEIIKPEKFSRAFGPLTRFKLYERLEDNQNWEIDFERPRKQVWDYVKYHYANIQATYNFDFMRGDMSHVQMRQNRVEEVDDFYDIHRSIKHHIQQKTPYFGYFAETFLAPPNEMAYGVEEDHLDLSDTDTTLGDLQSIPVGTPHFLQEFYRYYQLSKKRLFVPNFTIMTADKDDPRFDSFYLHGNIARLFMAFFLDLPSYMGLGFETRDIHHQPAPNEHYTKLYVFQISEGPKATHGSYHWGQNADLYTKITHLKKYVDSLPSVLEKPTIEWILAPNEEGTQKLLAWKWRTTTDFLFVVNLTKITKTTIQLPLTKDLDLTNFQLDFSTHFTVNLGLENGCVKRLLGGEGQVYRLV